MHTVRGKRGVQKRWDTVGELCVQSSGPPLSHRREPAMPMVRPMSGFAAVLQTWPLGDSIGVRQSIRWFTRLSKVYP